MRVLGVLAPYLMGIYPGALAARYERQLSSHLHKYGHAYD